MRFRALELVHDKVSGRARISKQEQQDFIDLLKHYPASIVGALHTKDMSALKRAMNIVIAVNDGTVKIPVILFPISRCVQKLIPYCQRNAPPCSPPVSS